MRLHALTIATLAALAACDGHLPGDQPIEPRTGGAAPVAGKIAEADDVVVIAVIDSNINPYHWDYLAAKMPQHLDADPANDLPLDQDPATWLPGHPGASAFKRYEPLALTLDADDPEADSQLLHDADIGEWSKVEYSEGSDNGQVSYYWFPGTKIIGHVAFSPGNLGDPVTGAVLGPSTGPIDTFATTSHGIGTSSVSAGNIHGTCPNCLIVYVHGTAEQANAWVAQQDWIDLQTNSWGASIIGGPVRDLVYAGSDTELQRQAIERGQQIFFSAGNGLLNDFSVPHTTLLSSQKGPDWIVTVGAIAPANSGSFSGHGKPADVASLGDGYPSAAGSDTDTRVTAEGNFGGTSNAAPVVAGIYAEALYRLRKQLPGASRAQADGVIAAGQLPCGAANPACALADGALTVHELREALYRSAQYTATGTVVGTSLLGEYFEIPQTSSVAELEFLAEGHGSYMGRFAGTEQYEAEIARILGFATGAWFEEQDADQAAWFVADAVCRQGGWGAWSFGYDQGREIPAPSPDWPVRTWLTEVCPTVLGVAVQAELAARAPFEP